MKHLTYWLLLISICSLPFSLAALNFGTTSSARSFLASGEWRDSIGVTLIKGIKHVQYRVGTGETPYSICKKYRISYYELLAVNPEVEKGLKVGQLVHVPYHINESFTAVVEDIQANYTLKHVVQAGETWYGLANRYHTTVEELIRLNASELKAGQVVVVGINAKATSAEAAHAPAQVAEQAVAAKADQPTAVKKDTTVIAAAKVNPASAGSTPQKAPVSPGTARKDTSLEVVPKNTSSQPVQSPQKTSASPVNEQPPVAVNEEERDHTRRVLVIPFDPYLYFSDADVEIANRSKITSTQVRYAFRNRLNALLEPSGYETIYLLGGKVKDSTADLSRAYASVSYGYRDIVLNAQSRYNEAEELRKEQEVKEVEKTWLQKQKEKFYTNQQTNTKAHIAKNEGQYYGVKVKDPSFFTYFNQKYNVDYYIFVSQFEVKTNYEHCLDRQREDYERNFIVHFSIFDANGRQIAGNKFKVFYNSNSNFIQKILNDNMPIIANRIMAEVPLPNY